MRQEGGKVYLYRTDNELWYYPFPSIDKENCPKQCEVLVYDFSLNVGQSWRMMDVYPDNVCMNQAGFGNLKEVDSVSYIQIQGVETKVQYVKSNLPFLTPVISGIGCTEHKTFPFPFLGAITTSLNHNFPTLVSFEDMNGNILWKHLGVSSVEESGASMTMEDDLLSVTAEGAWTVTVYGSDGRKVMQRKGYGSDTIALDGLGAGIYIARLQIATAAKTLKLIR